MLRCGISSSIDVLQCFHEIHPWIPGKDHIRPPDEIKQIKLDKIIELGSEWSSMTDYLLATLFNKPTRRSNSTNRLEVTNRDIEGRIVFAPNEFPYQVSGNHWILWLGTYIHDKIEISNLITSLLREQLRHDNFDFVWYENPKMTIPEIYHVQVFWKDFFSTEINHSDVPS